MRFLVDHNLPPKWAKLLGVLAEPPVAEVTALRDKFDQATADTVWIEKLASEGGWCFISGDMQITRSPAERAVWRSSGLTGFFFEPSWLRHNLHERTWRLVRYWPQIVNQAQNMRRGSGLVISINGRFRAVIA